MVKKNKKKKLKLSCAVLVLTAGSALQQSVPWLQLWNDSLSIRIPMRSPLWFKCLYNDSQIPSYTMDLKL